MKHTILWSQHSLTHNLGNAITGQGGIVIKRNSHKLRDINTNKHQIDFLKTSSFPLVASNRPFALYKMIGGEGAYTPIFFMLAGSEKCNFNATEANQKIIAKEKVQKASKKAIAMLPAVDLMILLSNATNYQGITPFVGSGKVSQTSSCKCLFSLWSGISQV